MKKTRLSLCALGFLALCAWLALSALRPPEDDMKYARQMADRIHEVALCQEYRQRILAAGHGSPTNAGTKYKIITAYEDAKKRNCVKAETAQALSPFWNAIAAYGWLFALALLIGILRTPWGKGLVGEMQVRLLARLFLDRSEYHAVHNVTLPTLDGTTQIDHVIVSRYGIFVVETKNYSGWIFGDERQPQWTQKIFRTTHRFQNPLRQNYKHLKALEAALEIPGEKLHSLVVFVGSSSFKTPMPANVTDAFGYIPYIKSRQETLLSPEDVDRLYEAIQSGRLKPGRATTREHLRNLQARDKPDAPRRCPRCGEAMILRSIEQGERAGNRFWGCSRFPRCRATQSV